jgi:O-antigen ligase
MGGIALLAILVCFMPRTTINLWGVTLCLLAGAALAGPPVVKEFMSSFKKEGEQRDSSAESRFVLWKAGYQITMDNPLLGVGPWGGQFLVPRYMAGGRGRDGVGGGAKGLHNLYFEIGAGCGIPAAICYFSYFAIAGWACFRLLWRQKREPIPDWLGCLCLAVFPGLIGYFISSMFSAGALLESSYALAAGGLAGTCVWAAEKRQSYGFSPQLAHFSQQTLGIPQVPGKLGRS